MNEENAAELTPWAWVAHCEKSGGEPIFVTAQVAAQLQKFDDWDVFQVAKLPSAAVQVATGLNNQPKMPTLVRQQAEKPCSQPQAHPARCGCEQEAGEYVQVDRAHQLLSRILRFDLAVKQGQEVQLCQLLSEIGVYLREQGK